MSNNNQEELFFISPELIEVDLGCAKSLAEGASKLMESDKLREEKIKVGIYHATQAIEKSIKRRIFIGSSKKDTVSDLKHSFADLIIKIDKYEPNFRTRYESFCNDHRHYTKNNNARYGFGNYTLAELRNTIALAEKIFNDLVIEREKPQPQMSIEDKAKEALKNEMLKRSSIATPNGLANPADGYEIRSISKMPRDPKHIILKVAMFSKNIALDEKNKDGNVCTFHFKKNHIYDEKQWKQRERDLDKLKHR